MSTKSKTTKSRSRKSSSKREPVHQSHVTNKTHLDTLPIELREKVYDEANEDIKRLLRKDLDSAYVGGLNIFEYDYEKIRKQLGIKRYDNNILFCSTRIFRVNIKNGICWTRYP